MNKKLNKMLADDKRRALSTALKKLNKSFYVLDYDQDELVVYFEDWEDGTYTAYKTSYTANEDYTEITLDSNFTDVEVTYNTEYIEKMSESLTQKVLSGIVKHFGATHSDKTSIPILKALDDEKMIAYEPLYIEPDGIDGHGWTASGEVLRAMTESCDKAIKEGRLLAKYDHGEVTNDFHFIKAFTMECDCYIGEHFVPEGQPMIKSQFTDKDAWEKRKTGVLKGVSIGAKGNWEEIEE